MMEMVIEALKNPASHALTLAIGAGLYHVFIAQPERKRNAKLWQRIDELFDLQAAALRRIADGE